MIVLVTGAAGFLGTAVVDRLLADGKSSVRCFVRATSDLSELKAVRSRYPSAHVEYVTGDLSAKDDLQIAVRGVKRIYHLAAGMRGLPATIFSNTVVASKHLINAIQGKGLRVVLVSSIGVYGTSHLPKGATIDEECALERSPENRNAYFHAKTWQERLFWEAATKHALDLVVLRSGILYSARHMPLPGRAGLRLGRLLLQFGGDSLLPLCHIVNCAAGVILAGDSSSASNQAYNLVDDGLPTIREYVKAYSRNVERLISVPFTFPATMLLSQVVQRYHAYSRGQIPRVLSPYESAAIWRGHRFDNRKIKALGWTQMIPTAQTFLGACDSRPQETASREPFNQMLQGRFR